MMERHEIKVLVIIPSLRPNNKLLELLESLRVQFEKAENADIKAATLLVDDGSGPEYAALFEQARDQYGCILLRHAVNLGKGRALKTAFNYFLNEMPHFHGVVTVDSDGQHAADDIICCIKELSGEGRLILGCRNFNQKDVPFKSRFGNKMTRNIFHFLGGTLVSDTQTGLRVIPAALLGTMLAIPGERFEYEMNMLIVCGFRGLKIKEVPIKTIYEDNNKATSFNPLFDSLKIYWTFLKYIASSLGAACVDFFIFWLLTSLDLRIAYAMVFARVIGIIFNFTVNRNIVFKSKKNIFMQAIKYLILAGVSGVAAYFIIIFLHGYLPLLVSKAIAETSLFFVNYYFQKTKIFNKED
jgi:putative flippase GtrA